MVITTITNNVGFSGRFNQLLNMAGFPQVNEGRYTTGAERFQLKSPVTFRNWCTEDKKPRTHEILLSVVKSLLKDIPGNYSHHSVTAWLYDGDAVNNPFKEEDNIDVILMLDVSLTVTDIAALANKTLTRSQSKEMTMKIYKHLAGQKRQGLTIEPVDENPDAINLINFCMGQVIDISNT